MDAVGVGVGEGWGVVEVQGGGGLAEGEGAERGGEGDVVAVWADAAQRERAGAGGRHGKGGEGPCVAGVPEGGGPLHGGCVVVERGMHADGPRGGDCSGEGHSVGGGFIVG